MRKQKEKIDFVIHFLVVLVSIGCFFVVCMDVQKNPVEQVGFFQIAGIIATAVCVNFIKALRMYLLIFDFRISLHKFVKFYTITAFVNITVPLKCGEVYRGYYLGNMVKSMSEGYILVILDRFVDTLALITVVIGANMFLGTDMDLVYLVLVAFVCIFFTIYLLFQPLYTYWNHYLIYNRSSNNTLKALHLLEGCHKLYENIREIIKGKFIILYVLSLIAWMVEMVSMVTLSSRFTGKYISEYLRDILTGETTQYNYFFVIGSILIYGVALIMVTLRRKGNRECRR